MGHTKSLPDALGDAGNEILEEIKRSILNEEVSASVLNHKRWEKEEMAQARRELFENGSDFLPTRREQIVGIENILMVVDDLIHWLKNPRLYQKWNARLEPGVIFEGSPGTGKTTVSRYMATESNALFVNVRNFPHNSPMFSPQDIKDLFKEARRAYKRTKRPVLLFWDEFEANASERSSASSETAAAVSQLTAELDGIHGKNEGVLLVACTNYYYGIDAALKRRGRMGIHIEFSAPDRQGKCALLEYYLGGYRVKGDLDLDSLAYLFGSHATAAEVEEACMEAWRLAVKRTIIENGANGRKQPTLTQQDLIPVFVQRLVGPPTAFISMAEEDRYRIAIHECGHALAALVWDIPLRIITVQPGKRALGKVITAEPNEFMGSIAEIVAEMQVAVGSIAAEQEAEIPAAIGATGDVQTLNIMGARLIDELYAGTRMGLMSIKAAIGVRAKGPAAVVSQTTLVDADRDLREMLDQTYHEAREMMSAIGKDRLDTIAREVISQVTMIGSDFTEYVTSVIGDPAQYQPRSVKAMALNLG